MIPSQLIPKYKRLVLIKTDLWNNLKTDKFKKKKWRPLIEILKKKTRFKKKKTVILNYNAKTVPKFPVYFRYKHQKNLIIRYKIRVIYGCLQDYKIKQLTKKQGVNSFARNLEQKVTTFIFRIGLTNTYGEAKIHFMHKRVIVNGSPLTRHIKKGDVLHFNPAFEKLLKRRIFKGFSSNYKINKIKSLNGVDFDFSSFRFYFIDNIKYYKNHPFFIPFEKTWRYYTRV